MRTETMWNEVKPYDSEHAQLRIDFSEDGKLAIGIPHYRVCHGDWAILNVDFQNGTIPEHGVNGVTLENLLDICLHRLQGFQATEFSCVENAEAIHGISFALRSLSNRTARRVAIGIEGTLKENELNTAAAELKVNPKGESKMIKSIKRLLSRLRPTRHIFVNGKDLIVRQRYATYKELVEMAYPFKPFSTDYTMTCSGKNISCTLQPGQSPIKLENGMKFCVVITGSA